jgi:flagellar biosynthesis/type III secretory pathway chaperone
MADHPGPQVPDTRVSGLGQKLLEVLDQEFESLRRRDLAYFERLQPGKVDLMEQLSSAVQRTREGDAGTAHLDTPTEQLLVRCRDAHRRNETLLRRQLEAVRGALQALSAGSPLQGVEVYDRLGQLRGRASGRGLGRA